jgi:hypothetical protein
MEVENLYGFKKRVNNYFTSKKYSVKRDLGKCSWHFEKLLAINDTQLYPFIIKSFIFNNNQS